MVRNNLLTFNDRCVSISNLDLHRRHGPLPSDLGSDAWSDLTSEFSDTKLRKHPNIRTSTPNITRYSSSVSSKEVGQIRRQLTGSFRK